LRVMAALRLNKALPNDPLAYVRAWTTKH
jgi:hypothetical protein